MFFDAPDKKQHEQSMFEMPKNGNRWGHVQRDSIFSKTTTNSPPPSWARIDKQQQSRPAMSRTIIEGDEFRLRYSFIDALQGVMFIFGATVLSNIMWGSEGRIFSTILFLIVSGWGAYQIYATATGKAKMILSTHGIGNDQLFGPEMIPWENVTGLALIKQKNSKHLSVKTNLPGPLIGTKSLRLPEAALKLENFELLNALKQHRPHLVANALNIMNDIGAKKLAVSWRGHSSL